MVAHLTLAEQYDDRTSLTTADRMQFGIQATLGSPDMTGNIPFLNRLAAFPRKAPR